MIASGGLGLLFLFGFGGGTGLPLGVPPLPEDPVLAKVAPEKCLIYASWSGMATPDPKSDNQTEQLLAEPEVQRMISELERKIRSGVVATAKREGPETAALLDDAAGWVKMLLTRPAAVFLTSVKPQAGPRQAPDVRGGVIVNLGEDAAKVKASLEKYQPLLMLGPMKAEDVEIGGQQWHRFQPAPDAPTITWGVKDEYLIVGIGEGEVEGILKRTRGDAPQWLAALRKQLPVERTSSVVCINVKAIVDIAVQAASRGADEEIHGVLAALGFANVASLSTVSGLDKEGFVSRTLLALDGEPEGILALATEKPLTAADLAPIPADATLAVAARVNPDRVFETVLSIVGKIEPRERDSMLRDMARAEQELGIEFRNDIFRAIGDTWRFYSSPSEGGLLPLGVVGVVNVKDYQRLSAAHDKLVASMQAEFRKGEEIRPKTKPAIKNSEEGDAPPRPVYRSRRPAPRVEQFEFAGKKVYLFNSGETDFPLAPAWCLTEKELIVALFPQGIKAYLSRGTQAKSLAKAPEVAALLEDGDGPLAFAYCDTRKMFDLVYPFVPMFAQMVMGEMSREGIDLDVSLLPSAGAIGKHLRPSVVSLRRSAAGIEVTSRQIMPGVGLATALPVTALYVRAAPRPAMRKVEVKSATSKTFKEETKPETKPAPAPKPAPPPKRPVRQSKPEAAPR